MGIGGRKAFVPAAAEGKDGEIGADAGGTSNEPEEGPGGGTTGVAGAGTMPADGVAITCCIAGRWRLCG